MNEGMRLGRNSLWLVGARIGAQVLALFTILLARKLGISAFGEYTFFTTVVVIGNILTTCGTDMFFIREIATRGTLIQLPAALWLQLFLSGVWIVGATLFAPLLPNQSLAAIAALQIYSLALIPMAFYTVFGTALRGMQHMNAYALLQLVGAGLQVIVVLVFVARGEGVVMLAMLLLAAQFVAACMAGLFCTVHIAGFWQDWRFSFTDVRAVAVASVPLAVLGVLGMFYQKLGVVLLSTLGGAALTGLFSAALRVVDASKAIHAAVFIALFPVMSQAHTDPDGQAARTVRSSWKMLLAGATVNALGMWLFAPLLVDWLYGDGFAASIPILRILAWLLVPYSLNTFLTLAFVASHRARAAGLALTVTLLGLGLLSLWWIPAYGLEGAAWAALVAECLQAVLLMIQFPQIQTWLLSLKPTFRALRRP